MTAPVVEEYDGDVNLFGSGGGKLDAPVDRLNHQNLPSRWFANSTHGPKAPTAIPTSNPVRPFPSSIAKTTRARKFGAGPDKNIPRVNIMRYNAEDEAKKEAAADASKTDASTSPHTETLSTRVRDPSFLKLDQSKLPLEIFDNPATYEQLFDKEETPDQWITRQKEENGKVLATSPYYNGDEWTMATCEVDSYDKETAQFAIKFPTAGGQTYAKKVRRLSVNFEKEDSAMYQERKKYCMDLRETTKAELRMDHFLESQDDEGVETIPDWLLDHIAKRIGDKELLAGISDPEHKSAPVLHNLVADVSQRYTRACKKVVLNLKIRNSKAMYKQYQELKLPSVNLIDPPAPLYGKMQLPNERTQFSKASERVSKKLFLSHPGVRRSVVDMYYQFFDKYSGPKGLFVDLDFDPKEVGTMDLNDFIARQDVACLNLVKTLNADWRRQVVDTLLDHCSSHFNFYESNIEKYKSSKLFTFLNVLSIRMAGILREMAEVSIQKVVDFVTRVTEQKVSVFDTTLKVVTEAGSKPGICCFPTLEDIKEKAIRGTVARIIESVGQIMRVDADLLTLLRIDVVAILPGINAEAVGAQYSAQIPSGGYPIPNDVDEVSGQPATSSSSKPPLVSPVAEADEQAPAKSSISPFLEELLAIARNAGASVDAMTVAGFSDANELKHCYVAHLDILNPETQEEVNKFSFLVKDKSYEEISDMLSRFATSRENAAITSSDVSPLCVVAVDCMQIKELVEVTAGKYINTILEALNTSLRGKNSGIIKAYEDILQKVSVRPTNEKELITLKAFVNSLGTVVRATKKRVEAIHELINLGGMYGFRIPFDDFALAYGTMEWPQRVNWAFTESQDALEKEKKKMQKQLAKDLITFDKHLESLKERQLKFLEYSDVEQLPTIVDEAINLDAALTAAELKGEEFNERENAFGYELTSYSIIDKVRTEFTEFFELWTMYADFDNNVEGWVSGPFLSLKATEVSEFVTMAYQKSYKLKNKLGDRAPGAADVAADLREKTSAFRKNIPLLEALGSKALLDRHWMMLSERLGHDLIPDQELTLQSMLDIDIMSKWEDVEEITTIANKEHGLMQKLKAMEGEWSELNIMVKEYKTTGTFIIGGTDEIYAMLDDQIVMAQTMLASPFIKHIRGPCQSFEKRLLYLQDTLDAFLMVQRTWMYLEPIFGSEDIMRQMPTEGRRFAAVDGFWRRTLVDIVKNPRAIDMAENEKLLDQFNDANKRLDLIQKGLEQYLEVKRLKFARFFFLSNDELLEILSQTKDPRAVQPFLNKCFEGIAKIAFRGEENGNNDDMVINRMLSSQGTSVELFPVIDPNLGQNKGNVENWLLELQSSMRLSLKRECKKCLESYPQMKRGDWCFAGYPSQCVLNISQLYWTKEAEDLMDKKGFKGLQEYDTIVSDQISEIVQIVRGKITKNQRRLMQALCTLDVHAGAVIKEMVAAKCSAKTEFEWLSQLRYYWLNQPDDYNRYGDTEEPFNLIPKILNAFQMYGYEYLGNSGRLVITPLTDRCYRTLMGAVSLMYGGAPAGPAGTGKTETTKDLSKACAIQCVVLNCSPEFDYKAMGKFFKGLAQSGAWSCFDEFNRILLEVLSVIAQQILTIQKAKRARVAKFEFEGTTLDLNPDANCFITMNPGYAGRQELPDNLKALFRPCAMMVPDYSLIAQVMLYANGFGDATVLARKLCQVLILASELLSNQKHYDYGMRAVFSILVRAGSLRLKLGDKWAEDLIVLSAVIDVNLPKFNSNDIPLFEGICRDLFPGVEPPTSDYGPLIPTIKSVTRRKGLQSTTAFVGSTIQLYETVQVRHGLMVVGQAYAGKTSCIDVLSQAMTEITDEDYPRKVNTYTLNPKSVASTQLYGSFDPNTHEWTDGVLAIMYRDISKDLSGDMNWIVFDGPVDTLWIESMNTVLDDNKKLCLVSGEIIKMSDYMRMIFEPADLDEASPATVSRVGVVFTEPERLGTQVLIDSWLESVDGFVYEDPVIMEENSLEEEITSPEGGPPKQSPNSSPKVSPRSGSGSPKGSPRKGASKGDIFRSALDWLLKPAIFFMNQYCKMPSRITRMEMTNNTLVLIRCLMKFPFDDEDPATKQPSEKDLPRWLENLAILSIVWSVGANTDTVGRKKFDDLFRMLIDGTLQEGAPTEWALFLAKTPDYEGDAKTNRKALDLIPNVGTVYDYKLDLIKCKWQPWIGKGGGSVESGITEYTDIVIETIDTVRNQYLAELLITCGKHVLINGSTGTGKSVATKKLLVEVLDQSKYVPVFVSFSAQTSANQTQDIIDGKLGKRRKGVYGPPPGTTAIIFVDDLNMPAKEEYGTQPAIELLRTWMCHGGWYDKQDPRWPFRANIDLQFVCAQGPPGGGASAITQRYARHFHTINYVPFNADSLTRIFSAICDWFLSDFMGAIKKLGDTLVKASTELYQDCQQALKPTPLKSHYTFNLRDLSKVFQGLSRADSESINEPEGLIRMWGHECERVFHDRLTTSDDRDIFKDIRERLCTKYFRKDWSAILGPRTPLLFGNFLDNRVEQANRKFTEFTDHTKLTTVCNEYLEDYNAMFPSPMNLVLFMNAIEHCCRIARVIGQPMGNAMLVGVGGSGRKSLTTLAVFICDMKLFQIQISKVYGKNEWRDDLRTVLRMAGEKQQHTVFLFGDTQIKREDFVEDINNILNTGEVPNLFENDMKSEIVETLRKPAAAAGLVDATAKDILNYFVEQSRQYLHIVLAFSPVSKKFRKRLLMFPSLINCTTIDWFDKWPTDALTAVANHFLEDQGMQDDILDAVVETCVDMQERVTNMSAAFLNELRRNYYVTPTSYLELIKTFKSLIGKKRDEVAGKRDRYQNGLTKILDTASQVGTMQEELIALQPKLKIAQKETAAKLIVVKKSEKEVGAQAAVVAKIVTACDITKAEALELKTSCEEMLAVAIPTLKAAEKALNSLSKSDLVEVKAMKTPPGGVKVTAEAVCLMMGVKPEKIKDPDNPNKKMWSYWEPSKKALWGDSSLLKKLSAYDKDNIDPEIVEKVGIFCERDDFTPKVVKKASVAAAGLCQWVHAMISYDKVAKEVEPRRIALKKASVDLAEAEAELAERNAELKVVQDELSALQEELRVTMEAKDKLEFDVKQCADRLASAEKLISGLGGEKDRWAQFVKDLTVQYENITGDILISSGVIAYLGSFTQTYRDSAVKAWSTLLQGKGITCAEKFSIIDTLGEPVIIREWNINKLPRDNLSISNAIMMEKSDRWPLMIDPQLQANMWIRSMESENGLRVCRQVQSDFVRTIENAIQFGRPVLLEDVPEIIDPVLESILLKQIVKIGGAPSIKVGDNMVPYEYSFKLYITTRLPNPHYPPETCVKVNLLNFMATFEGLMDQMLGVTVKDERPDLEEKRQKLVVQDALNKKQLKEIEDQILELLAKAEGNILDDSVLIETLGQAKITSDEIQVQVAQAEKTKAIIEKVRVTYEPIAARVSDLFFCISEMASVDPMYQYSLEWYIKLFLLSVSMSEQGENIVERVAAIIATFTITLYQAVCRSLFEKDKMLFSFLLTKTVKLAEKTIDPIELRYFLAGNTAVETSEPNPVDNGNGWLTNAAWKDILGLRDSCPNLAWITDDLKSNKSAYQKVFESKTPREVLAEYLGARTQQRFQELVLLRCLRPDKVVNEVQYYIRDELGAEFVDPPSFDLRVSYDIATCETPILFVLTTGADPMTVLLRLADQEGYTTDNGKLMAISLGQGQGPRAERAVQLAKDKGTWIVLQNCDLSESFMPTLERLAEETTTENTHENYRLWLTSMPCPSFPVSVLQNGVKMTLEPPRGMRQSLLGSYTMIQPDWLEEKISASEKKSRQFKKLVFSMCFFHATVGERIKFGPLGWNIPYGFSVPDLSISLDQLKLFVEEYDEIPYKMLNYCGAECNYGGRVTDDKDRRCILNVLVDFFTPKLMDDAYTFSKSGLFYAPTDGDHASYVEYIRTLPIAEGPECYGLHDNAAITSSILDTTKLLASALSLLPRSTAAGAKTWGEMLAETGGIVEAQLPDVFDLEKICIQYPTKYEDSSNTILTQELERYNVLLSRVKVSLRDVQRALKGEVVMSPELETMGNSVVNGRVPDKWGGYPSLKPLGSWVTDFLKRISFYQDWVDNDKPKTFWINGFYFTQAFLTGIRQNYARMKKIAIDLLAYDFQVYNHGDEETIERPASGAMVTGLFLEGCKWDSAATGCVGASDLMTGALVESDPRVLYLEMPMIHIKVLKGLDVPKRKSYACPVYKTSERRGMLSTTGHSTNFVMMIMLPMRKEDVFEIDMYSQQVSFFSFWLRCEHACVHLFSFSFVVVVEIL